MMLRPAFNKMSLPLGLKIALQGRIVTPSFAPRGEHSLLFKERRGEESDNFTPRGQCSPLWANITRRGKILLLGAKLKTDL
jgi:hypothetical protein